jgi:hypothetical protein
MAEAKNGLSKRHMFLKGPVPLWWLEKASKLGGKCLAVGVALWFLAGLKRTSTIKLTQRVRSRFGVGRGASRRCLYKLEKAGLIRAQRHQGRCPVVTLLKRGTTHEIAN